MTTRAVRIFGHPAPKGSMKCVGRGTRHQLVEANKNTAPWRTLIASAGPHLMGPDGHSWDGPVAIHLTFTLDRPTSVKRRWPTTQHKGAGDVDKLARTVLDGIEDSGALANDAQVCLLTVVKCYPDTPGQNQLGQAGVLITITDDLGDTDV